MKNAKTILEPIIDVMTCADGGVAFVRLRHDLVPHFINLAATNDPQAVEALKAFETVSKFCTYVLENQ